MVCLGPSWSVHTGSKVGVASNWREKRICGVSIWKDKKGLEMDVDKDRPQCGSVPDIIRKLYLVTAPVSWHTAPKTLKIFRKHKDLGTLKCLLAG